MFRRNWTTLSNCINHSTLNNGHNQVHVCISMKKPTNVQFPITIARQEWIRFSVQYLMMLHRRYAYATHVSACKPNQLVEVGEHGK
jgi:hypothetical protein